MSAFDLLLDPNVLLFLLLAAVVILSSLLVVGHKSIVYAAFSLGVLGLANAALFALLGFTFIGLFHVAVYVGAAVTYILFSVTLFEAVPSVGRQLRIVVGASVVLTFALLAVVFGSYLAGPVQLTYISYKQLASLLTGKYWFAFVVSALTLVTTLIEAITLARLEAKK